MRFREGIRNLFKGSEKPESKEEKIAKIKDRIKTIEQGVEVGGGYTTEDGELLRQLEDELSRLQSS